MDSGRPITVPAGDALVRVHAGRDHPVFAVQYRRSHVRFFDSTTGKAIPSAWWRPGMGTFTFTPIGGQALLTGKRLVLREVVTGKTLLSLPTPGKKRRICFAAKGTRLVMATPKRVRIWGTRTGKLVATHAIGPSDSILCETAKSLIVIARGQAAPRLIDGRNGRIVPLPRHVSAGLQELLADRDMRNHWSSESALTRKYIALPGNVVESEQRQGAERCLFVGRLDTGASVWHVHRGHWGEGIRALQWRADGLRLAVLTGGANVMLWNPVSGHATAKVAVKHDHNDLAISPRGKAMLVGGDLFVRGRGGVFTRKRQLFHNSVARYSPDGRWIAYGAGDRSIKLMDRLGKPRLLQFPPGRRAVLPTVERITFDATSRYVAVREGTNYSMNSRVTVVDTRRLLPPRVLWAAWLRSFKTVAKKPQVISCGVVFAADGRLAAGGANEVRIWKSVTAHTPRVERRVLGNCLALAFDRKGRLLVLIHTHQMRHEVWAIGQGQGRRAPRRLLTIAGPDAEITPVAFSPGGRYLATVEQSTAVLLWRIPD